MSEPVTAETITDDQIREMQRGITPQTHDNVIDAYWYALHGDSGRRRVCRETCARLWNLRLEKNS